jgi:hypothetical protein
MGGGCRDDGFVLRSCRIYLPLLESGGVCGLCDRRIFGAIAMKLYSCGNASARLDKLV